MTSKEQFFDGVVDLLKQFNWIYDFQMTEIFCGSKFNRDFPQDWIEFFTEISYTKLDELALSETHIEDARIPATLNVFLKQVKSLELSSRPEQCKHQSTHSESEAFIGLTAKKQHELKLMMPFIRDLCHANESKWLIDVGSGVGHFDKYLVTRSDVNVIGIERKSDFIAGANKRQRSEFEDSRRLVNVPFTLDDTNGADLMKTVQKYTNGDSMGMISLHSCGDLTPAMLRTFAQSTHTGLKFLCAFSCCYHSMSREEEVDGNQTFANFPMSDCLKQVLSRHDNFQLSLFGLRLACQQDISCVTGKSRVEHELHVRQVAYRAILQRFVNDRNLRMIKLKRKLAGRSEFESFEHYIDFLLERITFQDATNENQTQLDIDLHTELRNYYKKYESYFALIEPLTYLQLLLQPLIERLILYDRVVFLDEATNKENGTTNKLVKVFDSLISPRCICILSERA